MSITGTYIFDKTTKKLAKVSDRIPRVSFIDDAYVPEGGYVDWHIAGKPIEIRSRRQKLALMRQFGVSEKQGRHDDSRRHESEYQKRKRIESFVAKTLEEGGF